LQSLTTLPCIHTKISKSSNTEHTLHFAAF
jgi:hypothetical protein